MHLFLCTIRPSCDEGSFERSVFQDVGIGIGEEARSISKRMIFSAKNIEVNYTCGCIINLKVSELV